MAPVGFFFHILPENEGVIYRTGKRQRDVSVWWNPLGGPKFSSGVAKSTLGPPLPPTPCPTPRFWAGSRVLCVSRPLPPFLPPFEAQPFCDLFQFRWNLLFLVCCNKGEIIIKAMWAPGGVFWGWKWGGRGGRKARGSQQLPAFLHGSAAAIGWRSRGRLLRRFLLAAAFRCLRAFRLPFLVLGQTSYRVGTGRSEQGLRAGTDRSRQGQAGLRGTGGNGQEWAGAGSGCEERAGTGRSRQGRRAGVGRSCGG